MRLNWKSSTATEPASNGSAGLRPASDLQTAPGWLRAGAPPGQRGPRTLAGRQAFTLLELLLGLAVSAVVLVAIHAIFYGALLLRNTSAASFDNSLPLQQAVAQIKRDLAGLTPPGGILTGTLQTTPTTTTTAATLIPTGTPVSPALYTASGALNEFSPWSEIRKVTYHLAVPTNFVPGRQLVRSVTRNLLPVLTEEYENQVLLENVGDLTFEFHDGTQWQTTWDSASGTNGLPAGIRVALTLVHPQTGVPDAAPIEVFVPILTQGVVTTNSGGEQ